MSRLRDLQTALKPVDLVILLYLSSIASERQTYAEMAGALMLAPSQVYTSLRRSSSSRLVILAARERPAINRQALRDFVLFGARYAFPAVLGPASTGMVTGYAASPLREQIVQGDTELPPVWPWKDGNTRGLALYPLHPTVPAVAALNSPLYELLALFDALRAGAARERELATELLVRRL